MNKAHVQKLRLRPHLVSTPATKRLDNLNNKQPRQFSHNNGENGTLFHHGVGPRPHNRAGAHAQVSKGAGFRASGPKSDAGRGGGAATNSTSSSTAAKPRVLTTYPRRQRVFFVRHAESLTNVNKHEMQDAAKDKKFLKASKNLFGLCKTGFDARLSLQKVPSNAWQ